MARQLVIGSAAAYVFRCFQKYNIYVFKSLFLYVYDSGNQKTEV